MAAVSAPGGGKITLVVGAGCSLEDPTSIPLAGTCSRECHDRLVADGVLAAGDCATPEDLSCLADTVFAKTGGQRPLVDQLTQHYFFKTATPNEGHILAAALLGEGAIGSVVTLNFDLALTMAIGELGVGDAVAIIDGPDDLTSQKAMNLYYLHRNANADPEAWVLRTEALRTEWKGRWQSVVAAKVLSTPVVIFAGLGSPAGVLVESTRLIQEAIPTGSRTYQVDPGEASQSPFFKALALEPAAYIRSKWCEFMAALSQRLVVKQTDHLKAAAATMVARDQLAPEDISSLISRLQEIGLLCFGRLRASWLLDRKPYHRDEPLTHELVADLLLAAAMIARTSKATAVLFDDGVVEFQRGGRTVASHVFATGRGTRSRIAIEAELSARQRTFRSRATQPTGAIVAATQGRSAANVSAPRDVVRGDTTESILAGPAPLPIYFVDWLREDPARSAQVVP